MIQTIISFGK